MDSYLSLSHQQQTNQHEFVSGLLQGEVTFTGILERYLHTKELISAHTKQLECLETSQQKQDEQMKTIDREMTLLKDLKQEETKLSKQLDLSLQQLETQVKTNTKHIKLCLMTHSTSSPQQTPTQVVDDTNTTISTPPLVINSKEGDILLSRLVAIEKQVVTNTKLLHRDNGSVSNDDDISLKQELETQKQLIKNLYLLIGTLQDQINELSARVETSSNQQQQQPNDSMSSGIIQRLKRRNSSSPSKRLSLPGSLAEDFEYLSYSELNDTVFDQRGSLSDSGFKSRSTSVRESLSFSSSSAIATDIRSLNEPPKDSSTPGKSVSSQ